MWVGGTHVTTYGLVLSFFHNLFLNHGVWILVSLILACFFLSYCKGFILSFLAIENLKLLLPFMNESFQQTLLILPCV